MKALIHSILIVSGSLFCRNGCAQTIELDSTQIERVAKTCQLWGHINYFHPYLADDSIDWESAFTDAIEQVIEAENPIQFRDAIQHMLDPLQDPATAVVNELPYASREDTVAYPRISFLEDSTLLVTIHDYGDLKNVRQAIDKFAQLQKEMNRAKGAIFDIRSPTAIGDAKGYLSYLMARIEKNFTSETIQLPTLRARFHDGFVPERGTTSGRYTSGFYSQHPKTIEPNPSTVAKPLVFIVNEYAEIPQSVLGLQMAGECQIIATTPLTDASIAEATNFSLSDSVKVVIRTNELLPTTPLEADYSMYSSDSVELITLATKLIRGEEIKYSDNDFNLRKVATPSEDQPQKKRVSPQQKNMYYPDVAHRLLAVAKIWTVIDYFFAYQDLMEDDWNSVLEEYIPRFALASDSLEYHLAVAEMYQHLQDGHGFIRSDVLNEYFGKAAPPVQIHYIENQPVVVSILPDSVHTVQEVEIGDIIISIDGERATDRFDRYAKYTAASNRSWLKNSIAKKLLNGKDSSQLSLQIQQPSGTMKTVTLVRKGTFTRYWQEFGNGRNAQSVTRLINPNIGYADLDRLTTQEVDTMFARFKDTKAIIFDMRGYPNGTAWSIAPYLTPETNVQAANFRRYSPMEINLGNMKRMSFFNQPIPPPKNPTYQGKTFMLIDERTMSQAEHTGLFFKAANETTFIGSQTAGANGDVTNFQIPGNMILYFSGHDVRHINGNQLQQVGLIPDVVAKPTIEGVKAGKDEVLEKAIEHVKNTVG